MCSRCSWGEVFWLSWLPAMCATGVGESTCAKAMACFAVRYAQLQCTCLFFLIRNVELALHFTPFPQHHHHHRHHKTGQGDCLPLVAAPEGGVPGWHADQQGGHHHRCGWGSAPVVRLLARVGQRTCSAAACVGGSMHLFFGCLLECNRGSSGPQATAQADDCQQVPAA